MDKYLILNFIKNKNLIRKIGKNLGRPWLIATSKSRSKANFTKS